MNSLKEIFESRQTILWIETQNPVAFLRPVPDIVLGTPCPAAGLAESLRLRQIRFAALQLLSQLLLLGDVQAGPHKPRENPVFEDGSTEIAYHSKLAIGPDNSIFQVEGSARLREKLCNGFLYALAIFGMQKLHDLVVRKVSFCRIKAEDTKHLRGPELADVRWSIGPTANLGEVL